jgi:hypothetical protein
MNKLYTLLALALVIGMASCSSSRNAQNTDDIYYSDGTKKAAAGSTSGGDASQGEYYSTAPSDNYVRMKATDPDRWSYFDDYNAYDSYYYSPMAASASFGYGYPAYGLGFGSGLGYGYGMGFGYGLGFGYGMGFWDPYFAWNSWYNPYFYNPYYGGAVFATAHGLPASAAYGMRPFNATAYRNGVAQRNGAATTGLRNNPLYRQGMSSTTAYNSHLSGTSNYNSFRNGNGNGNAGFRNGNSNQGYRPVNNNFGGQTRSYSAPSSVGGNSGGGFRSGGGGFRH